MEPAVPEFAKPILQEKLSVQAWLDPRLSRLPGVQPLDVCDWLIRDSAFDAQMTYRDHLLMHKRSAVFEALPTAKDASQELLEVLVDECGFPNNGKDVARPDGIDVSLHGEHSLIAAARLTQMDMCILQNDGEGYTLDAGVMCFPSSWTLSQKIGRSLASIHIPVDEYDDRIATSVDRMLSAIRVEQPLWRANMLIYTDPELHQPRLEGIAKPIDPKAPRYVRVERQSFRRLPKTRAVVFGIHTSIVAESSLSEESHAALAKLKPVLLRIP